MMALMRRRVGTRLRERRRSLGAYSLRGRRGPDAGRGPRRPRERRGAGRPGPSPSGTPRGPATGSATTKWSGPRACAATRTASSSSRRHTLLRHFCGYLRGTPPGRPALRLLRRRQAYALPGHRPHFSISGRGPWCLLAFDPESLRLAWTSSSSAASRRSSRSRAGSSDPEEHALLRGARRRGRRPRLHLPGLDARGGRRQARRHPHCADPSPGEPRRAHRDVGTPRPTIHIVAAAERRQLACDLHLAVAMPAEAAAAAAPLRRPSRGHRDRAPRRQASRHSRWLSNCLPRRRPDISNEAVLDRHRRSDDAR